MVAAISEYEVSITLVLFYIICNKAEIDFIHTYCSQEYLGGSQN